MEDFEVKAIGDNTIKFTDDQQKAYDSITEFLRKPFDPENFKVALSGAGGTGKTFLIKYIIQHCGLSTSLVGLSTPTHKAARVLSESTKLPVSTIHSDLGFSPDFNLDDFSEKDIKFSKQRESKLQLYKIYILDEASMINKALLKYIEKCCVTSGIKIVYSGDASQLAPVKEKHSMAFYGLPVYTLNQVVRQSDDNPLKELLEVLRYDVKTGKQTFLNLLARKPKVLSSDGTKGWAAVKQSIFNQAVAHCFSDKELESNIDKYRMLAFTNRSVNGWNNIIRCNVINHGNDIICKDDLIMSYATILDEFNDKVITNSEDYIINSVSDYRDPKYGMKGYIVRFRAIHGGSIRSHLFVIDHNDEFSIQMYARLLSDKLTDAKSSNNLASVRAAKWREYFKFKSEYLIMTDLSYADGTFLCGRNIDYGFGISIHRSQGSTYDNVLIDLNDILYVNGRPNRDRDLVNRLLYVAVSRARNKAILNYGM